MGGKAKQVSGFDSAQIGLLRWPVLTSSGERRRVLAMMCKKWAGYFYTTAPIGLRSYLSRAGYLPSAQSPVRPAPGAHPACPWNHGHSRTGMPNVPLRGCQAY